MSFEDPDTDEEPSVGVKERHRRYFIAVSNSLRRKILRILKGEDATLEVLQSRTGLDLETLKWHLSMLEYGFCVEREVRGSATFYKLTKEGRVIDYLRE